jgi:hypothetical protein
MVDEKQKHFIEKSREVHRDRFDYKNSKYRNIDTKVEIRCVKHNMTFYQSPYNHMNGREGCLECINESKRKRLSRTLDQFIYEAKSVHGDRYDYSKVDYKGGGTPVCLVCSTHGEFYMSPSNHIHSKQNCYKCSLVIRGTKRRKSNSQFIADAITVHRDLYDYGKTVYQHAGKKITVTCRKHGDFECSPKDHLYSKSGCPKCNASKGEFQIRNILKHNSIEFIEQYRFKDCRDKLPLPFDFYLPEMNSCIEYDGEGHYKPFYRGGVCENKFETGKLHDDIKTLYCEKTGIRLIRIPFWQLNDIETVIKFQLGIQ